MTIREEIACQYGDELLFLDPPETFDKCIVGVASRCGMDDVVVYSEDKIIEALIDQGATPDDAREWLDTNIAGAFVGERTPMIMSSLPGVPGFDPGVVS